MNSVYLSGEIAEIKEVLDGPALTNNLFRRQMADPVDSELEELMSEEASEKHIKCIDK